MQFGELFAVKPIAFATELASVVLTLLIVWFSLPPCALVIVEFSRKLTVHDGLGYVCTVALPCLDFQRHGNVKVRHALCLTSACRFSPLRVHAQFGAPTKVPDVRPMSNDRKMEISFVSIKAMHPEWIPADLTGLLYLLRIVDLSARPGHNCHRGHHRPRMGVRTGTTRVADCGCAAARWGHCWEPCICGDVDNAQTVDRNGVPAWDGAECRARHPTAAVSPAVFLYRIFISEEGDTNADSKR